MALTIPDNTQVSPQGIPNARFRSDASPSLLGGEARYDAAMGRSLHDAAGVANTVAIKEQQDRNLARVSAADAALGQESLGYEDQLRSRNGLQADGSVKEAQQWWDQKASEYQGKLDNPAQQQAFQQMFQRKRAASMARIAAHQRVQMDQAKKEGIQASIVNDINEAAASAGDPDSIQAALTGLNRKVNALAISEGWDAQTRDAYLEEKRTLAHKGVIDRLVVADPRAARDYYEAHKDQIAGSSRAAIEAKLKTAGDRAEAQSRSDQIMAKGLSETEALAEARKIKDPEVRDSAVTRIKARFAETRTIQKNDEQDAADQAWKTVIKDKPQSIDDLPLDLYSRLSGPDRKQISDYLTAVHARDKAEDDWPKLTAVEKMIEQGDITDPDQLNRYEPFFTRTTFQNLRKSVEKNATVPQTDVLHAFETRKGETRTKFMDNTSDRNEWLAFKAYINERVKETHRPEDIDQWADKWFMEGHGTKDTLFHNDPDTYGEAVTAGRKDFVITTPDKDKPNVEAAVKVLGNAGYETKGGELATDEFYTRYYLDAAQYLHAHEAAITPTYVAAYAYLRQTGNPITPANLNYVAKQLNGK